VRIAGLISNEQGRAMFAQHAEKQSQKQSTRGNSGNKYGAEKVVNENGKFDSVHEAGWIETLLELERRGFIKELRTDKRELKYSFDVNGVRVGEYTADARFDVVRDCEINTVEGRTILRAGKNYVCDAKSKQTRKIRDYPLRRNLMYAVHRIKILEL
jgi:hypothetical protein